MYHIYLKSLICWTEGVIVRRSCYLLVFFWQVHCCYSVAMALLDCHAAVHNAAWGGMAVCPLATRVHRLVRSLSGGPHTHPRKIIGLSSALHAWPEDPFLAAFGHGPTVQCTTLLLLLQLLPNPPPWAPHLLRATSASVMFKIRLHLRPLQCWLPQIQNLPYLWLFDKIHPKF